MGTKSEISGFILAGGKSVRMGTDKALLLIEDEPLMQRMISLIQQNCERNYISGQNKDYSVFNLEMVPDLISGIGPIAGIYSALKHSKTEWNLLVSVDTPFLNNELLELLISSQGEFDCVIPQHTNGVEPLAGLYHKRIISEIEEMIKNGDYKLMNLLSRLNTRYLDCNPLIKKHPRLFMNLNRMEDYRSI